MEDERFIEDLILEKQNNPLHKLKCNLVLNLLINGVCDKQCSLSLLIGAPHILFTIWNHIVTYWRLLVKEGEDFSEDPKDSIEDHFSHSYIVMVPKNVAFCPMYNGYTFPEPKDICINMMPFFMEKTFEKCKLPEYLKPYWDAIINVDDDYTSKLIPDSEYGKIGFLTIHESFVKKDETQRRPGLHTDSPGKVMIVSNKDGDSVSLGRVNQEEESEVGNFIVSRLGEGSGSYQEVNSINSWWGGGCHELMLSGGIYMMSNVPDSCLVYNCRIVPDEEGNEIIGELGDIEHLSDILPPDSCETMKPNTMYWITDRTPHMALPLEEPAYRQYFRLVTSKVSLWYEEHSTANPLGVVPDPEITTIVKGSKFERNWSLLLN